MKSGTKKIFARLIFSIGLILTLFVCIFLISNYATITHLQIAASFLLMIIGGFCAILAIKLKKRSFFLFFAAFLILTGLFLFFKALGFITLTKIQSLPILTIFAGLALLPAGWHRYGELKGAYLVPSAAFIVLGGFLMFFSLDITGFSFRQFMLDWWPVIILMAGIMLVLLSLSGKKERGA
jgi:hypothetical protein